MIIELRRRKTERNQTLGTLFQVVEPQNHLKHLCFTIEDEFRKVKIKTKTRIPKGCYPVTLRKAGGYYERYTKIFGSMFKGSLWIRDVPGFSWILIHCGNTHLSSAGCIIIGRNQTATSVTQSRDCFREIYPQLAKEAEKNNLWINITDHPLDKPVDV